MKLSCSATLLVGGLLLASPVDAAEKQEDVQIDKVDESTMQLNLDEGISFEENEYYEVFLTDDETGEREKLPLETEDKNGAPISLVYIENDDGVEVQALSNTTQTRGIGKCITGTAGGAVTGGGTLGIAGTAAGTAVPGIGNATLGAAGATVGAIGGGLTGASQSCFD